MGRLTGISFSETTYYGKIMKIKTCLYEQRFFWITND